jgi:F-type H+-transporting ATPase subunit delta
MRNVTVARRYARALYQLARDGKNLDDVQQGMNNLAFALQSSAPFRRMLVNPLIKLEVKHKLIASVTSNKLVLKFTDLLARRKRADLLAAIHEQFSTLVDASQGLHRALVKTAAPLSDDQKRVVETDIAKRMGGKVLGQFEVAKDLIGGVWIKMGDKVLDASIKGRIETFRHSLLHSTN